MPSSTLPEHFDRYSILRHLATGGMAEVYLARQAGMRGFEKLVVIKRIRPELTSGDGAVEAFLDEARLVAMLEHPHIVQVHEIGCVAGSYFFVMEHVDGVDLRQLLAACAGRGEVLSLANALYIAIDLCAALHYAHDRCGPDGAPLGIVHRDLSPSNVLISHDGTVKVCDFGIAKTAAHGPETERGMVKGKFSYMSPEQCMSAPLDRRSDVFALGILLYEMTTGLHLFQGASAYEVMCSIVDEPILPPSAYVRDYPVELERIVMRALARDPAARYPSARELQTALEELACEHRLAMSSTHLASLVNRLFAQRRDTARILAEGSARRPAARLVTRARRLPAGDPPFSSDASTIVVPQHALDREVRERRAADRGHRGLGWLAAAAVAALVAAGATIAGRDVADAGREAARVALEADAEHIAAAVDAAVLVAHAHDGSAPAGGGYHVVARGGELVVVAGGAGAPAAPIEL
ncbi:MAG TPA: serine/threonine-protein kinase, partial [Kofleriaceae bacterium]|nr:serine/threonine-protein kinase [Kofleriaceae bacterium]